MKYKLTKIIKSHRGRLTAMDAAENILLTSSEDTTLKVFEISTCRLLTTYTHHKLCVNDARIAGVFLYSCGQDRRIRSLDLCTNKVAGDYFGHTDSVTKIDVGPTLVSGSSDKSVRVWDIRTGNEVARYLGHTCPITGVISGEKILSSSSDGTLRVWDRRESKTLHLEKGVKAIAKGEAGVYAVLKDNVVVFDTTFNVLKAYKASGVRSVSSSGNTVCFGSDSKVDVWRGDKSASVKCLGWIDCIVAYKKYVFCGGSNKKIHVIEMESEDV